MSFAIGAVGFERRRPLAGLHPWTTPSSARYTLFPSRTLDTGKVLPGSGRARRLGRGTADNFNLFYTTVEDEEQKRQYQLWRHLRGTPYFGDYLIYQDDDERFNVGGGPHARRQIHRDGIGQPHHHRAPSPEVRRTSLKAKFRRHLQARRRARVLPSIIGSACWFIRTNDKGRNFRLVTCPVGEEQCENWVERIPHRDNVMRRSIADLFNRFLHRVRSLKAACRGCASRGSFTTPPLTRANRRNRLS